MGSGQSARKLTIHNEEDIDVIKVSNAVVQRLTQRIEETVPETSKDVRPTTPFQPAAAAPPQPFHGSEPSPPPSGYPVFYYPELTLTALQIQQQKEEELLNQDNYWQKRLHNLEKSHLKINSIIEEECRKAVEELYTKNGKKGDTIQDAVQPCLENIGKVIKCYQEHPREILKCSPLVEEFSKCVDERRANVIAARC